MAWPYHATSVALFANSEHLYNATVLVKRIKINRERQTVQMQKQRRIKYESSINKEAGVYESEAELASLLKFMRYLKIALLFRHIMS